MFTLGIILHSLSGPILAQQAEKTERKCKGVKERKGENFHRNSSVDTAVVASIPIKAFRDPATC